MFTTSAALLLAFAAFGAYEIVTSRSEMQLEVSITADMIAVNSTAAISFDDPKAAEEALSVLRVDRHIQSAGIYRHGTLFAQYGKDHDSSTALPATVSGERVWFSN